MTYAIVQLDLTPPPVEAVRAALAHTKGLLPGDAARLAKDAYGILADRLSEEDADAIRQGLAGQGIETAVVEQSLLPVLPERQKVSQIDCLDENLIVHDALDRPTAIPWPEVRLVAAGLVVSPSTVERKSVPQDTLSQVLKRVTLAGGMAPPFPALIGDYFRPKSKLIRKPAVPEWSLEIIVNLHGAAGRFWTGAGHVRTTYLRDRIGPDSTKNFLMMTADLVRYATAACLNRGAVGMTQSPPTETKYPSRRTFEEEMVWLLWNAARRA